ncbi:MAG TPA: YjjG family noncanonical pyrimidine nucleotidase [Candidatus Dorea gallistercoris]|uniref:YjjG family noncanonical pyrimidine nucleotidase n=1 Tax=Candidatus Dorea gallistercoris TaxID=2838542 RepID=A0A9D1RBZ5_9FIRM|nr:YjjG family noncanonical pyrimidine nucleotidase [Candidatus Dorea gallistercoris]
MIRNIFFDLDNTLFDFDKAEARAVSHTLRELGIEPTPAVIRRYSELNQEQWKLLELGRLTRREVKLRRYQLLFDELHVDCPAAIAARIYETQLGIGHYFMEGAPKLLEALYGNYLLYLVTNGTASVQKSRLESAGIKRYFEAVFISEEMGADKPSIAYFDACFSRIPAFRKDDAVIIGDSLTSDIKGGINAGIRTIWFNPGGAENPADIRPDFEIRSLNQIPTLLERLG